MNLNENIDMEIENLKALIKGVKLNSYQKALAVREFENLLASNGHENQALSMSNVVGRSGSVFCDCDLPALIGNSLTNEVLCVKCKRPAKTDPKQIDMKWISIKDRLPNNLSEVIISDIKTGEVISGMIFINNKFQDANDANRVLYFPTHWMPLPEPPKV